MLTLSYFHEDFQLSYSVVDYILYLIVISHNNNNKKNALIKSFSNIFFTHSQLRQTLERVRANNGNDCQQDKIELVIMRREREREGEDETLIKNAN